MPAAESEILRFGPVTVAIHVAGELTGGSFCVIEELPPLADTPAHVHEREDEYFYAVEGEHVVTIGDEEHRLRPGAGVFAPRRVPHAQRRVTPGVGRMLIVFAPAGFEGFFRSLAAAESRGELGEQAYAAASAEFGITWL